MTEDTTEVITAGTTDYGFVINDLSASSADDQPVEKILYSKRDAAYALSISLRTLSYLIQKNELPVRKIGGRILIEKRELDKFSRRDHFSIQ